MKRKSKFVFCLLGLLVLAGCQNHRHELGDQTETFVAQNAVMKAHGPDFVVYEYQNIRIDDLASLAIAYCTENAAGKSAYLREIILAQNSKRRARFDCVDIALNK